MSSAPSSQSRPDGRGYIDDRTAAPEDVATPNSPTPSGSSISEETDDEDGQPEFRRFLHDDLLAKRPVLDDEESDYDELDIAELELDEEDWDLLDGDFTKQYNRMRQAREVSQAVGTRPMPARNMAAVHNAVKTPAARQNAEAGPSRAQKSAPAAAGITSNPKAVVTKVKDKSQRATTEQVLDHRTKTTLRALWSRGVIGTMTSCISTGKEANVYHSFRAETPPEPYPEALAVKIFRTSILGFRSRQDYMQGEQRFRNEYTSSRNARKMVKIWAEKELRNLRRLGGVNIRSPQALECKENVLVLEFLGHDLQAAPRLKDAEIDVDDLPGLYAELLVTIRRMFQDAKLVHADLSEYNILYHESHLYIIDVSQSVEHDHPRAFEFLRRDLQKIEEYFTKRSGGSVRTLGLRRACEFVMAELKAKTEEELLDIVHERMEEEQTNEGDDSAFLHTHIPRALAEIQDPERMISLGGLGVEAGHPTLLADAPTSDAPEAVGSESLPEAEDIEKSDSEGDQLAETESEAAAADAEPAGPTPQNRGFRHEDRDEKKARKQAVKEENREKRKHKMPKAQKQKLVKKTAR